MLVKKWTLGGYIRLVIYTIGTYLLLTYIILLCSDILWLDFHRLNDLIYFSFGSHIVNFYITILYT